MNSRIPAYLAFAAVVAVPGLAHAHTWTFCMKWVVTSVDSDVGEDYHVNTTLMNAHGAKVSVDHVNWAVPIETFADEDTGCFTFTASENTGFRVEMSAESRIGGTDNITIKAYNSALNRDFDNVQSWVIFADPGGSGRTITLQNSASVLSNLIAWPTHVIRTIDQDTSPRLSGSHILHVTHEPCVVGGSCQVTDDVQIETGTDAYLKKFLIGHEVGHWLQWSWGAQEDVHYSYSATTPACAYSGVGDHALRSEEWSSGAMSEGFVHYLSTLAFNSHGSTNAAFRYYKEIDDILDGDTPAYADLADDGWIVNVEGGTGSTISGGPTDWYDNNCSFTNGTSVELDWLRFFWDYRTNAVTAPAVRPTHHEIFEHMAFTITEYPWVKDTAYDQLTAALADTDLGQTQHQTRWSTLAAANGIDQ